MTARNLHEHVVAMVAWALRFDRFDTQQLRQQNYRLPFRANRNERLMFLPRMDYWQLRPLRRGLKGKQGCHMVNTRKQQCRAGGRGEAFGGAGETAFPSPRSQAERTTTFVEGSEMCKCRRYEYLGVTEKGIWFRVRDQRPVARWTCRLPSSGEGGWKGGKDDQTKGRKVGGGGNHGRKEEASTEADGANDRQDVSSRVGEWESTRAVCGNESKPLKLFSTYFPSPFPSVTSSADQDDLPNVPSLRVHIAAHIYDGLRGKVRKRRGASTGPLTDVVANWSVCSIHNWNDDGAFLEIRAIKMGAKPAMAFPPHQGVVLPCAVSWVGLKIGSKFARNLEWYSSRNEGVLAVLPGPGEKRPPWPWQTPACLVNKLNALNPGDTCFYNLRFACQPSNDFYCFLRRPGKGHTFHSQSDPQQMDLFTLYGTHDSRLSVGPEPEDAFSCAGFRLSKERSLGSRISRRKPTVQGVIPVGQNVVLRILQGKAVWMDFVLRANTLEEPRPHTLSHARMHLPVNLPVTTAPEKLGPSEPMSDTYFCVPAILTAKAAIQGGQQQRVRHVDSIGAPTRR
ncbi:hypothetical protein BC826DRAFT_1176710 [Russula brevipes]|nr:hypothetical protein BC826DRAFT_1176710 [Russula brevipes]